MDDFLYIVFLDGAEEMGWVSYLTRNDFYRVFYLLFAQQSL